ncbi:MULTISPECIES: alpha/beta fold hydrolase [Gordonia]|jgi:pimeloyl-ACP methyl ester carboxylesterase|uniref:alpha/beta fold hydrolase n=1 Tax=Gordonia TaxID=2053 RepID=UPI00080DABA3|nr:MULTISPECIES: alpha/beta hydrolase [Gordonia]MDT0220774.1 alpha/beta hydrolase [Gordonia sp. AC31]OCH83241.1 alpha/beta hydrolase [Gordonia sp. UCD-TK1]UPG70236.1 alpha/beta hydrolase [Gordonia hongkongensis]
MPGTDGPHRPRPTALVGIPGTGSDADHVTRSFQRAAADLGVELIALDPTTPLIDGHLRGLERAAGAHRSILVGGVSIGAAIALEWALQDTDRRCAGVLAALPAWSGDAHSAPAAASAGATADALERDGLEATIAAMASSSPDWLAAELTRSWRGLYPGLAGMLREAARHRAPTPAEIAGLTVPLAIVAAADDPVHPIAVAREWHAAAPQSTLVEIALDDWGHDPGVLGDELRAGLVALTDPPG